MPASVALISCPTAPAALAVLLLTTLCTALTHILGHAYNATQVILDCTFPLKLLLIVVKFIKDYPDIQFVYQH